MKKTGLLCLVLLFLLGCLPALAADEPLTFCDVTETPDITGISGYPRFARLQDGSLMLANSGTVRISKDSGKTWTRYGITGSASTTATSSSGQTHTLVLENWQPFVLSDGTVLMAYRARTKGYVEEAGSEFYTSIRVMTSTNASGTAFGDEQILVEGTYDGKFRGFWEPFMIQLDDDTVALYYADDLNDTGYQYIKFITYNIPTKEWNTTPQIAVDGVTRESRDGMPAVTKLQDGSFAMVVEASNVYKYYPTNFAIALFRSEDGIHWDTVPTIVARPDYTPHQCAAPFIATLPDGRVAITYMTTEDYVGTIKNAEKVYNSVFGMIVSDEPLTYETVLTDSTKGAAAGFTELVSPFDEVQNGYQVWNTVFYSNGELYVAGSAGVNDTSTTRSGSKLVIRRADVSVPDPDPVPDPEPDVSYPDLFSYKEVYLAFGGTGDGSADATPIGSSGNGLEGVNNALALLPDGGTLYAATGKKIAILGGATATFPARSQGILITAVAETLDTANATPNGGDSFKLTATGSTTTTTMTIAANALVKFDHIKLIAEGAGTKKILVKSGAVLIVTNDIVYSKVSSESHYTLELEAGATVYLSAAAKENFTIVNKSGGNVCDYDPAIDAVYCGFNGKGTGLADGSPIGGGGTGAPSVAEALALMPDGGTLYAATGKKIAIMKADFIFPATKKGILITAPSFDAADTAENGNNSFKLTAGETTPATVTIAENARVTFDHIKLIAEGAGTKTITVKNGATLTVTDDVTYTYYNAGDTPQHYVLNLEAGSTAILGKGALDNFTIVNNGGTVKVYDPVKFNFASVTLENDLAINFYAEETQFVGYDNIRVLFTVGGETVNVSAYDTRKVGGTEYRVYRYDGINATQMGKEVTAQIALSRNGVAVSGKDAVYSVKTYAMHMLARTEDATLKTLLVDLLNYGAAAQTYCNVDVENLVNKDLTAEQQGYATQDDPTLTSVEAVSDGSDQPIVADSVSLSVGSHVVINYYFNNAGYTGTADDLRLKVTYAGHTEILGSEAFKKTESGWKVSFASLNATELSATVTATVISAETSEALSNTVTYSVESYAKETRDDPNAKANLVRLVNNMMKYGNAAAAYFAAKEG